MTSLMKLVMRVIAVSPKQNNFLNAEATRHLVQAHFSSLNSICKVLRCDDFAAHYSFMSHVLIYN